MVEAAVYCTEARWVSVAWDLESEEAVADLGVPPDPSHPRLTAPNDSVASASSAGWAKDCPIDFRSCLASATVWNLQNAN